MSRSASSPNLVALALILACSTCKAQDDSPASGSGETPPQGVPAATGTEREASAPAPAGDAELDRLLAWLSPEPLAVAYDRLGQRLDPSVLAVVFAIPMKSAGMLDERETLDEALDIVFDGEAEPQNWLESSSLSYTIALSKTPYFVRPLRKGAAEVGPLLELGGFTKNDVDGVELWLPSGSFPWRIALLEGEVAAFIPVDVPGTGLEVLQEAKAATDNPVEAELRRALSEDPLLELVLFSSGPLLHVAVRQTLAQIQFGLRKIPGPSGVAGYEGQIRIQPTADVDECANDLRARTHPEENKQVQALLGQVQFEVVEGGVVGQLAIGPDDLKHIVVRD